MGPGLAHGLGGRDPELGLLGRATARLCALDGFTYLASMKAEHLGENGTYQSEEN